MNYDAHEAAPGLAMRMSTLSESSTLALNAKAKQLAADGKTVYNLTAGELAIDTPPYIQSRVATMLQHNKYTPVAGLPELRDAISTAASAFYGHTYTEKSVVVTAGAKPALYASLLALVNPGDEVIVPVPMWVSYQSLVELAGGTVVSVPLTDSFDIDPDAVAAALSPRTKAIILNSPHNPTGAVFSKKALDRLAAILHNTGVTVIADDIYAKLVYDETFSPVAKHAFEHVIIVNGFSKSQALTGWRIGYLIADEPIAAAATALLSHIAGNAPLPSQHAALAALLHNNDTPPDLARLGRQRQLVHEHLNAIPNIRHQVPKGAFYVFIDIREITGSSATWCERLLDQTGVALVPGEAFGAPGFARLSFVADGQTLRTALKRIRIFAANGETS